MRNVIDVKDAEDLIWVFSSTYRLDDQGRFVNKVGQEAPQRSIDLVAQAQALLAGEL